MTERKGGSDVSGTETIALYDPENAQVQLGDWSISGFKWFSSATDADMSLLLAQTEKGLSLFYAPMYLPTSSEVEGVRPGLNGVRIQRLKSKLGTRGLPTAELELVGMRGRLVGKEGCGIKEITTVLTITRVHNAVTAMAGWGRGLGVAKAYSKVRLIKSGRQRLIDTPAHVATLAKQIIEYRGWLMLTFATVSMLGEEEWAEAGHKINGPEQPKTKACLLKDRKRLSAILRLLTPVAKALTAKASIAGLQECMESLGGVGYLENNESDSSLNIARLYRDSNVLSIWEGTTDIMADDLVRVLKGKAALYTLDALAEWLEILLKHAERKMVTGLTAAFQKWKSQVQAAGSDELKANGRDCMQKLGWIIVTALLLKDASNEASPYKGGEGEELALEIARRWFWKGQQGEMSRHGDWQADFIFNRRLVEGAAEGLDVKPRL